MDWDILGHEWAARLLSQHIARGEARHAYLFTGPPGVGRRTLALRFAQALNCTRLPEPGQPCRTCRDCRQFETMQHPDLSIVQRSEEVTSIKVEQIRDLQHSLNLSPFQSRQRVALLLRFEEATASAQNALLKTLEEAPERAVLLLTADTAENLLPTVASRCEVLRLRPLPVDALAAALETRWGKPAEEARKLAHLAGGRVGYALRLASDPPLLTRYSAWQDDFFELLGSSLRRRFAYAERACDYRSGRVLLLPELLKTWLTLWRDTWISASGAAVPLTHIDREPHIRHLAAQVGADEALARTAALEQALAKLDANVNARLLVEVVLMDWPRVG